MTILDRHRIARLVELAALERTLRGPERLLRESEVRDFVRAAYDDAGDAARADFMERIQARASEFPWFAVQATPGASRTGGDLGALAAAPGASGSPVVLVLLRGQVESADVDPGDRLPERGTTAGLEWEPLYRALDAWDTRTILKAIGPQGWVSLLGAPSGQVSRNMSESAGDPPAGEPAGKSVSPPEDASSPPADLPAPAEATAAIPWRHPAVIAAGATVVVVVGGVVLYRIGQSRRLSRLEEALGRQEELP